MAGRQELIPIDYSTLWVFYEAFAFKAPSFIICCVGRVESPISLAKNKCSRSAIINLSDAGLKFPAGVTEFQMSSL